MPNWKAASSHFFLVDGQTDFILYNLKVVYQTQCFYEHSAHREMCIYDMQVGTST